MVPETTTIRPQNGEGSLDAHRWQQFSVLPDNWKRSPWGGGLACILYVDFNDRRGDETVWASTMDSVGGTAADLPTKENPDPQKVVVNTGDREGDALDPTYLTYDDLNPNFKQPNRYQSPRQFRFGIRYTF
jgi:hypothetical protein